MGLVDGVRYLGILWSLYSLTYSLTWLQRSPIPETAGSPVSSHYTQTQTPIKPNNAMWRTMTLWLASDPLSSGFQWAHGLMFPKNGIVLHGWKVIPIRSNLCFYVLRMVENKCPKTLMTSRGRRLEGAFKEEVDFLFSIISNPTLVQSSLQKECQDFAQKKK